MFFALQYLGNLSLAKEHIYRIVLKIFLFVRSKSFLSPQQIFKTTTAIKDLILLCDHVVSFEDFKILPNSNSEFNLKIKQSLLISCDKPELNRNKKSLLLYLFD